jgi:hypothetical protein
MHQTAKAAARQRVDTIEFEFRRRYSLAETDPRFLELTTEEMLTDLWAHRYADDPKALEEAEDPDFDPDDVAAQIGYREPELPDDFEDL